jgi:cation transport regulator ChaC
MTLHFAYGSNMCRVAMGRRCPEAVALGPAILDGWRFVIGIGGHGSIEPQPGWVVHGVLWRLGARDLAAINAYEGVDTGVYLRRILPVRHGARRRPALVYIVRRPGHGKPRPAYMQMILEAARAWKLPQHHIRSLQRWSPPAASLERAQRSQEKSDER